MLRLQKLKYFLLKLQIEVHKVIAYSEPLCTHTDPSKELFLLILLAVFLGVGVCRQKSVTIKKTPPSNMWFFLTPLPPATTINQSTCPPIAYNHARTN
jgi:hypothetical protein